MLPEITAFNGEEHQAFTLHGGDAAALLIHGFPGTPDEMRPLAEVLHQAGWTAHALLLPGFGAEINTIAHKKYGEWTNAIDAAIIELQQVYSTIILIGFSMGGALAIGAAARLQVDGLILLAPFHKIEHILWRTLPAIQIAMPTFKPFRLFKPDFNNPEMREGILNFMPDLDLDDPETQAAIKDFKVPVRMFAQIRKAGLNAYDVAPKIMIPTLVIQGRQDELVKPEITKQLISRFVTQPKLVEVDAEHDLPRDDRPAWDTVTEAILSFVAQIQPSPQET